jgi:hypothetical protein
MFIKFLIHYSKLLDFGIGSSLLQQLRLDQLQEIYSRASNIEGRGLIHAIKSKIINDIPSVSCIFLKFIKYYSPG